MDDLKENYILHLSHAKERMGSTYLGMTPTGSEIKITFKKKSSDAYRAELFLNGNLYTSRSLAADDAERATELLDDAGILDLIAEEYTNITDQFMSWLTDAKPAQFC